MLDSEPCSSKGSRRYRWQHHTSHVACSWPRLVHLMSTSHPGPAGEGRRAMKRSGTDLQANLPSLRTVCRCRPLGIPALMTSRLVL